MNHRCPPIRRRRRRQRGRRPPRTRHRARLQLVARPAKHRHRRQRHLFSRRNPDPGPRGGRDNSRATELSAGISRPCRRAPPQETSPPTGGEVGRRRRLTTWRRRPLGAPLQRHSSFYILDKTFAYICRQHKFPRIFPKERLERFVRRTGQTRARVIEEALSSISKLSRSFLPTSSYPLASG